MPSEAFEEFFGVTPHSCQYCEEFFALIFPLMDVKSLESKRWRTVDDSRRVYRRKRNEQGRYDFFLNVDLEDIRAAAEQGCPLCCQWNGFAAEKEITADEFALAVSTRDAGTGPYFSLCMPVKTPISGYDQDWAISYRMVQGRPLNSTPGDLPSLRRTANWLCECRHHHERCRIRTVQTSPQYLIHISTLRSGYLTQLVSVPRRFSFDYAFFDILLGRVLN